MEIHREKLLLLLSQQGENCFDLLHAITTSECFGVFEFKQINAFITFFPLWISTRWF